MKRLVSLACSFWVLFLFNIPIFKRRMHANDVCCISLHYCTYDRSLLLSWNITTRRESCELLREQKAMWFTRRWMNGSKINSKVNYECNNTINCNNQWNCRKKRDDNPLVQRLFPKVFYNKHTFFLRSFIICTKSSLKINNCNLV